MNPVPHLKDPAAGIPPQLLAHLHLLSRHRYPTSNNPSRETIVGYLLEAPKVIRELSPVGWQFLDCPPDGTLMLAWQPHEYLHTNFASDGYIYADAEQYFKSEVRGFTLEMFHQRCGYRPMAEAIATHSRRRYRLLPSTQPMGLPTPDPSLWIIHYSKASPRDQIPAASIPVMPIVGAQLQQRRLIQTQGQLPRKDFMLHDRSNWPTVGLPAAVARAGMPGQAVAAAQHKRLSSVGMPEVAVEEEEDVSRGDILDFMTPRDISRMRYEQHHEWLEEVLESPYGTFDIIPPELGFGRKGELEELTRDFFDAPISAHYEPSANSHPPRVGKMSPGKAAEFTKRANQKIRDMQAEIERLKQKHAQRMSKMRRIAQLNEAEKKLRTESATVERKRSSGDQTSQEQGRSDVADQIVKEVEGTVGKQIELGSNVRCVSKGGLDERSAISEARQDSIKSTSTKPDVDSMPPQERQMQVQQQNEPQQSEQPQTRPPTEVQSPKPDIDPSGHGDSQDDPDNENEEFLIGDDNDEEDPGTLHESADPLFDDLGMEDDDVNVDVDMNMDSFGDIDQGEDGENNNVGDGQEWVMVDEQEQQLQQPPDPSQALPQENEFPQQVVESTKSDEDRTTNALPNIPLTNNNQPQDTSQFQPQIRQPQSTGTANSQPNVAPTSNDEDDAALNEADFAMGNEDFDDLNADTAGDALASYGDGDDDNDDLGLGDMDDSAFGEAFQTHEHDHDQDEGLD